MLSPFLGFASLLALWPQGTDGDEQAPVGLTIVMVNVDQGDATVIRAPDGTIHVMDGGAGGYGTSAVAPVIRSLAPTGYGNTFLSHYDIDHVGGIDEVLGAFPFQFAYDRGDTNRPNNSFVTSYLAAASTRRRTAIEGQTFALGGGVTATAICVNGRVMDGTVIPVSGTAQEENSRSLALRVDYGSFSIWLGGDLTGGGNSTADVETAASNACGNVDVYHVNHHGSNTSTNVNLLNRLAPELAVVSAGSGNSFGHPTITTINRINQAAKSVMLVSTTEGAGALGFSVTSNLTLTTDGLRYRAAAANGEFIDYWVDETTGRTPTASDLRITELQRDPAVVGDGNGEWFELTNIGASPVSLRGVSIQTNTGTFTIGSELMAVPGRPLVVQADGWSGRNGGLPFGLVWPFSAIGLSNSGDTMVLRSGGTTLDSLAWTSSFPGGSGIASERRDLSGASSSSNFAAAAGPYGLGDKGSPGKRNLADNSAMPATIVVEPSATALVLRGAALSDGGLYSVIGLALGNTGFPFLGAQIPLDADGLLLLTLQLPGFVVVLPSEGYRSYTFPLPSPNPLSGLQAYAAHVMLDINAGSVSRVSSAVPFVFP